MGRLHEPIRYLDRAEMDAIHGAALDILAETGMWIDSDEALDHLAGYGCSVNSATRRVRFPRAVTQDAVDHMRRQYADPARIPARMSVRYSEIYFSTRPYQVHADFTTNTGGFCVFIYDLEGRRRPATLEDTRACIRLADALPNIDYMGLPVAAQDVPPVMRPVMMAAELVKAHGNWRWRSSTAGRGFVTHRGIAAGSPEMPSNPILVGYSEARSPLCIDRNMVRSSSPTSRPACPSHSIRCPTAASRLRSLPQECWPWAWPKRWAD
jgi:trimethylamine--corrinoid protein Co-methyltransferase